MQLKLATDHAIRILLFLALYPPRRSGAEISAQMGISKSSVNRIMPKLKAMDWVDSEDKKTDGYWLKVSPGDLTLLQIIEAMEGTTRINRCLEEDQYCTRFATASCPVRKSYAIIQNILEDNLSRITLQNMADDCGDA